MHQARLFPRPMPAPCSDGGYNPPLGVANMLALVGLKAHEGVVEAVGLTLNSSDYSTIQVEPQEGGSSLIGLKITARQILGLREDRGRGKPYLNWSVSSPTTNAALVYFAGDTGRIDTVIASNDMATSSTSGAGVVQTQAANGRLTLRGSFTAAYNGRNPQANLISNTAQQIVLDSRTGQLLSAQ